MMATPYSIQIQDIYTVYQKRVELHSGGISTVIDCSLSLRL